MANSKASSMQSEEAVHIASSSTEEANLRLTKPVDSAADHSDMNRLIKLSSLALIGKFHDSFKVESAPHLELYIFILDMNGILLEKMPPVLGHKGLYSFREDVGQFLEFCLRNFEVVFWYSCNHRNLRAMFQALSYVCSNKCIE